MKRPWMAIATIALLWSCGGETARRRTHFDFTVQGVNAVSTNEHGWRITLTHAEISLTSVQFFEGDPLFARILREISFVRTAHAHPGHYVEGEALGDMLTASTVDLLAAPVSVGEGNGVTGEYRSAEVLVASARVEGMAEKDGSTVMFSADVALEDPIRGISFGAVVDSIAGSIEMKVDLSKWLARADFSGVADGPLAAGSQTHNALLRGLINTSSFEFEWKESVP